MTAPKYSVHQQPISTLLAWVRSGAIAIPEIQRPFVWEATKVRNLLDSLYQGFPVGYLIAWQNPTVKLKDGTAAAGKRILIDGQQRVTALMAALLGQQVLTKDYDTVRIRIAFHPRDQRFEVANPAIRKDSAWIPDVAMLFAPEASLLQITRAYLVANPSAEEEETYGTLERVQKVTNNLVGIIDLAEDLDIETVTEIFIRVNSAGTELSQADFAMSKIASSEKYAGGMLRKAIDYFCHLTIAPDFMSHIEEKDHAFAASEFFPKMRWLKNVNDDLYDPTYTDMLRVAFTSEFRRGRLADLVALLSGRNFETREYEEAIAEASFDRLRIGIHNFMNQTHFERFSMIIRSAGFITSDLVVGRSAIDFAYILYLRGRSDGLTEIDIQSIVRRWYAMSLIRGRYTGSPETAFDLDIRQIDARGMRPYVDSVLASELPDSFWTGLLPQLMDTSSSISPYFIAYKAAQVKAGDLGFLSRDITVDALLRNRTDVHHLYPANHLKKAGLPRGRYNQIANFALTQSEINIAIGDKDPAVYFEQLEEQCSGGVVRYGAIKDMPEMRRNLAMHCIDPALLEGAVPAFDEFLVERRRRMALKIRDWYQAL